MAKIPSFMFYPGDWLRDGVAGCSLAAQGLWLRMMLVAHDSERYGYLCRNGVAIPPDSIARLCGCDQAQYMSLLAELDSAAVPSRTPDGILFSRRMVRDSKARTERRKSGKKGGNPSLVNHTLKPPLEYESEYEIEIEIENGKADRPVELPKGFPSTPDSAAKHADCVGCGAVFAVTVWNQAVSRGGKDSKGNPIQSFRHHLASMWTYEQSRKHEAANGRPVNGADTIVRQKEFDRVVDRMKVIRGQYADHQTWTEPDRKEFARLKDRKGELKKQLGLEI